MPSINASSPGENGGFVNPAGGVVIAHVKIPDELDNTFLIPIPLLLFVVNKFTGLSERP